MSDPRGEGVPMPLAPWRLYKSWTCLKCGVCCKHYTVPLNQTEAKLYSILFGDQVLDKVGSKTVLRKIDNRCVFQTGPLCSINNIKPRNCKLWPFIVRKKPLKKATAKLAEFEYLGEKYYVYVDTFCRGLNAGEKPIQYSVMEAINQYLNYKPFQEHFGFFIITSPPHKPNYLNNILSHKSRTSRLSKSW